MMSKGNRIKIAQVITRMDWGGSPDIVRLLCTHLDHERYDVTLITGPSRHRSRKTRQFFEEFSDRIVTVPQLQRDIHPLRDIGALARLYSLFSREKYDLIHTHTAKAGFLGRLAARLSGRHRLIHTPHGHNFYGYFGKPMTACIIALERWVARWTDLLIALTELEKEDYLRLRIAADSRIKVIHQGIETEDRKVDSQRKAALREEFGIHNDEVVVSFIGRLETVKGAAYFVDALLDLARRHGYLKFLVVGEGALRCRLQRVVEKAGLESRVHFTGWRNDSEDILEITDILAVASLNEAVGMVLIEAMSHGVAVVATRVGGIPEVIKDRETGILVRAADKRALADAIDELVCDPGSRERFSEAGRLWVRDRFNVDSMIRAVSSLYDELLTGHGKL